MLPAPHRMRRREDFSQAVRSGRRAGRALLVVHLLAPAVRPAQEAGSPVPCASAEPAKVGFVVSRAVGGAVVRTQVKRRLRHQAARRLERLPAGSLLVVRANPGAASATSEQLGVDLDRAMDRVLTAVRRPSLRPAPARASVVGGEAGAR